MTEAARSMACPKCFSHLASRNQDGDVVCTMCGTVRPARGAVVAAGASAGVAEWVAEGYAIAERLEGRARQLRAAGRGLVAQALDIRHMLARRRGWTDESRARFLATIRAKRAVAKTVAGRKDGRVGS